MAERRSDVTFEIEGTEDLARRLDSGKMIRGPFKNVLESATVLGQKKAVDGINGGTGIAVRSINREVMDMSARVYSAMPRARAMSIEEGRRPGESISRLLPQLIRWRDAVGHPETGAVIAQGVQARGVKGRFFMKSARDAIKDDMPRLLGIMSREIQTQYKKR